MSELLFISVFNFGVIEMAKNHLKSLRNQGITNHRSYVTDFESFTTLKELGYAVTFLEDAGILKESTNFGTADFNNMSYLRYFIIKRLLDQGVDVWYMDVDTVVLQNLTPTYEEQKHRGNFDICFQSDINMPCTGCMMIFNNERTKTFIDSVIRHRNSESNDQLIVNYLLKQNTQVLKHVTLSTFLFPNGLLYFGEDFVKCPEQYRVIKNTYHLNVDKVVHFVHANWMVGDNTKTEAFKKYGLWFI